MFPAIQTKLDNFKNEAQIVNYNFLLLKYQHQAFKRGLKNLQSLQNRLVELQQLNLDTDFTEASIKEEKIRIRECLKDNKNFDATILHFVLNNDNAENIPFFELFLKAHEKTLETNIQHREFKIRLEILQTHQARLVGLQQLTLQIDSTVIAIKASIKEEKIRIRECLKDNKNFDTTILHFVLNNDNAENIPFFKLFLKTHEKTLDTNIQHPEFKVRLEILQTLQARLVGLQQLRLETGATVASYKAFIKVSIKEHKIGIRECIKTTKNLDTTILHFVLNNDNTVENRIFLKKFLKVNKKMLDTNIHNLRILFYSILFTNYKLNEKSIFVAENVPINLIYLLDSIDSLSTFIYMLQPYLQEVLQNFPIVTNKLSHLIEVLKTEPGKIDINVLNKVVNYISTNELKEFLNKFLIYTLDQADKAVLQLILIALNKDDPSCFSKISNIHGLINITNIVCGNTWDINQGETNLCGIDVMTRYMVKSSPFIFVKLALGLLFKGKASYNDFYLTANKYSLLVEQDFMLAFMSAIKHHNSTFGYSRFFLSFFELCIGVTPPSDLEQLFVQLGYKININTLRLTNLENKIEAYFSNIDGLIKSYAEIRELIAALKINNSYCVPIQYAGGYLTALKQKKIISSVLEKETVAPLFFQYSQEENSSKLEASIQILLEHFCKDTISTIKYDVSFPMIPHYVCLTGCELLEDKVNITYETYGNIFSATLTIQQFSKLFLGFIHPSLEYKLDAYLEKSEQQKLMLFSAGFKQEPDNYSFLKDNIVVKNNIIDAYLNVVQYF